MAVSRAIVVMASLLLVTISEARDLSYGAIGADAGNLCGPLRPDRCLPPPSRSYTRGCEKESRCRGGQDDRAQKCFREKFVTKYRDMGFDRKKTEFIHAMKVLSGTSRSTREHKMEVYRRWGWSEDNVQVAFKKYPLLMKLSEKKIMGNMDFLWNKLGCQNEDIARYPFILQFSFEKRVIPRCSVIKVLLSKALIKNDVRLSTFFDAKRQVFPGEVCHQISGRYSSIVGCISRENEFLETRLCV